MDGLQVMYLMIPVFLAGMWLGTQIVGSPSIDEMKRRIVDDMVSRDSRKNAETKLASELYNKAYPDVR